MTVAFGRTGRFAAFAAALAVLLAACGGGSPTSPPGGGGGGGGGGSVTVGATVTIANGRVSPSSVEVNAGQSVAFVNQDGRVHNVSSDPHPDHNQCPEITVGNINNGQTRTTGALTIRRTCGYHDHDDPDNANLKGSITIR